MVHLLDKTAKSEWRKSAIRHAHVAKRVNPSKAMMGGRNDHQVVGFQNLFVSVKGVETVQELG